MKKDLDKSDDVGSLVASKTLKKFCDNPKGSSELGRSEDRQRLRVTKPLGVFVSMRNASPVRRSRLCRTSTADGARGQKTSLRKRVKTYSPDLLQGCGFDPEQFVGASVTRVFSPRVIAFPFIPLSGGVRGGLLERFIQGIPRD